MKRKWPHAAPGRLKVDTGNHVFPKGIGRYCNDGIPGRDSTPFPFHSHSLTVERRPSVPWVAGVKVGLELEDLFRLSCFHDSLNYSQLNAARAQLIPVIPTLPLAPSCCDVSLLHWITTALNPGTGVGVGQWVASQQHPTSLLPQGTSIPWDVGHRDGTRPGSWWDVGYGHGSLSVSHGVWDMGM